MSNPGRIILAGGTGFLGSDLARHFSAAGWRVTVLSRSANSESSNPAIRFVAWDARSLGPWTDLLEGCEAVVNLAGRSINCRFTPQNREEILGSRVNSTRALGEAIARCKTPPRVWLNCSGVGIYNESFDKALDETSLDFSEADRGRSFPGNVVRQWEQTLNAAATPATRKVALRISMVLGAKEGTSFRILRKLARAGLAGTMGSGKQYISWIHEADLCRIVEWLIQKPDIQGPVNVTAPSPVTNREFMRTLRHTCGRSFGLPASAWMLKIGALFTGTEPELILRSQRCVPGRLFASGFEFQFPELQQALNDLERKVQLA